MKMLNGENEYGIVVPYIFVTNGGGKTEAERCVQLSKQMEIEVSPGQFICGHTPMREMAEKYNTVLVVGGEGEKCRIVAEGYGFKDVVTPGDIIKDNQDTTPFRKLTEEEYKNSRARNFAEVEIEAIFVFADSRDWASDQQIILDLLMSKKGRLGTRSANFDEGPPVFFSHNDVVWSASHDLTRIGMGALRVSLEAMFKAVTGRELKTTAFGKPQIGTFEFATRLLKEWRRDTHFTWPQQVSSKSPLMPLWMRTFAFEFEGERRKRFFECLSYDVLVNRLLSGVGSRCVLSLGRFAVCPVGHRTEPEPSGTKFQISNLSLSIRWFGRRGATCESVAFCSCVRALAKYAFCCWSTPALAFLVRCSEPPVQFMCIAYRHCSITARVEGESCEKR